MPTERDNWNLPAPPEFQGLREDLPLVFYERHLPHWRQDGATYFVTFRLADSLPQEKVEYLVQLRREWELCHPGPRSKVQWEELLQATMRLAEGWLDEGIGACELRDSRAADILERAFHHFDMTEPDWTVGWTSGPTAKNTSLTVGPEVQPTGTPRYELGCYTIMPNHVHVVIRPLDPKKYSLEKILQSWKTFTAREINALFNHEGTLWQQESFDRIIRDEEHLWRVVQYIGRNPHMANLNPREYRLAIRPSWERLGWRFVET